MAEDTPEPTLTLEELQQFFEARKPVLTVSPVGEEAGLSQGHLNRVLKGERILSETTITKLLPVLRKHGYRMPQTPTSTTLTLEQLQDFLNERKRTIAVTFLAQEAGISAGHFHHILAGTKNFTQKTAEKLVKVLPKYGYRG